MKAKGVSVMTDSEFRAKVREMRKIANELETDLSRRVCVFNREDGYGINDLWLYANISVARDAAKQISQLCAFNFNV